MPIEIVEPNDYKPLSAKEWKTYVEALNQLANDIDFYARYEMKAHWRDYFQQVDSISAETNLEGLRQYVSPEMLNQLDRATQRFEKRWGIVRWVLLLFTDVKYKLSLYHYLRFTEHLDALNQHVISNKDKGPNTPLVRRFMEDLTQAISRLPRLSRLRYLFQSFYQKIKASTQLLFMRMRNVSQGHQPELADDTVGSSEPSIEPQGEVEANLTQEEVRDLRRRAHLPRISTTSTTRPLPHSRKALTASLNTTTATRVKIAPQKHTGDYSTQEVRKNAYERIFSSIIYKGLADLAQGIRDDITNGKALDEIKQNAKRQYHQFLLWCSPDKHVNTYRQVQEAMRTVLESYQLKTLTRDAEGKIDLTLFGSFGGEDEQDILSSARHEYSIYLREHYNYFCKALDTVYSSHSPNHKSDFIAELDDIIIKRTEISARFKSAFQHCFNYLIHNEWSEIELATSNELLHTLKELNGLQAQRKAQQDRIIEQQQKILEQQKQMAKLNERRREQQDIELEQIARRSAQQDIEIAQKEEIIKLKRQIIELLKQNKVPQDIIEQRKLIEGAYDFFAAKLSVPKELVDAIRTNSVTVDDILRNSLLWGMAQKKPQPDKKAKIQVTPS